MEAGQGKWFLGLVMRAQLGRGLVARVILELLMAVVYVCKQLARQTVVAAAVMVVQALLLMLRYVHKKGTRGRCGGGM
jgi:hypothetical protein